MNHSLVTTKKYQSGFSLIQVMVVMAIMSVLALAIGTLITSVTGQQAHLTKAFEKQKIFDNLRATISVGNRQCAVALKIDSVDVGTLATGIPELGLVTGETISSITATPDGLIASRPFRFINQTNVTIQRKEDPANPGTDLDYEVVSALIVTEDATTSPGLTNPGIVLEKTSSQSGTTDSFRPEAFPIMMLVNPVTKQPDYCFMGGDVNDRICEDMFNGTYDDALNVKCQIPRFAVSRAHVQNIASAGNFFVEDTMSLYATSAAGSILKFETATSATSSAVTMGAANTQGQLAYTSGTGFLLTPSMATIGTNFSMNAADANFTNFQRINITKSAATGAGTALSVTAAVKTNPGLAVRGTSTFDGDTNIGAAGNTSNLTVVGNSTYTGSMTLTGASTFNGNMQVNGNINVTGQVTANSDRRLKTDIRKITDALNRISQIQGVTYLKKNFEDHRELGVLAQEVQKVFPEAVVEREDGYLAVNYSGLIAPLIESVKELKSEQEDLKAQMEQLKRELASLKKNKK